MQNTFASLSFRGNAVEFETNEQGQIDLAFWNMGSVKYCGYRHPVPESSRTQLEQD